MFFLVVISIAVLILAFVSAQGPKATAEAAGLYTTRCAIWHGPDYAAKTPMNQRFNLRDLRVPEVWKLVDSDPSHSVTQVNGGRPAFGKNLGEDQTQLFGCPHPRIGKKQSIGEVVMATSNQGLSPTDQLSGSARRRGIVDALPGSGFLATAELPPRIYEALKTLCCLAAAKKPLQAHEVAAATTLPPPQTAKILQQMTWASFVESRRGTKGGFWLVKLAARIRVADIVAFFTHPAPSEERKDPLVQALVRATAPCRKEFSHITIADLARLSSSNVPPSVPKGKTTVSRRPTAPHESEKAAVKRSRP
jgi:DNA-binding IscR family transcriptional regulator